MNNILFRGKKVDTGEWVYGYYVVFIEGVRKCHCIISDNKEYSEILDERQIKYYVIPQTIGQFIGLKDKNDKKIFEGDIVRDSFKNIKNNIVHIDYIVKYDEINYGFDPFCDYQFMARSLEVIGNIFDNPELIKESE